MFAYVLKVKVHCELVTRHTLPIWEFPSWLDTLYSDVYIWNCYWDLVFVKIKVLRMLMRTLLAP